VTEMCCERRSCRAGLGKQADADLDPSTFCAQTSLHLAIALSPGICDTGVPVSITGIKHF